MQNNNTSKMKNTISQVAIELTIHIIYAVCAYEKNITWVVIGGAVITIIIACFLMATTYYTCCRNLEFTTKASSEEITGLNQTYINYSNVDTDNLSKNRMSQFSMDTEHEFSYYDPIVNNNRPASEVATMKIL
ncbi:uncharacterized protein LOC123005645 [Tribolium madens]|uniref:uncharacterized protein LOC123005645 n=1 Tax=Tribolium madens TaxID=41895 RepID=UPI001CF74288|nr:uncharacterized protein LOC123005645 [Tribolium madens]